MPEVRIKVAPDTVAYADAENHKLVVEFAIPALLRPSRFLSPLIPRRTDAREDVLAGPIRSEQDPRPFV